VTQKISESLELGAFVGFHGDRVVPASPKGALPVVKTLYLAGELRLEVPHELRQVFCIPRCQEKVKVVGGKGEGIDRHQEAALGSAQRTEDSQAELASRTQEIAALEGTVRYFH